MAKKLNERLIRGDYSYTVEQIADMFGVCVTTVRRWISDEGLERIPKVRPYLVHSSALRLFVARKNAKHKKPLKDNEMLCMKCQSQRVPKPASAIAEHLANRSVRVRALCGDCGSKMNRAVKGAKWSANHPLAHFLTEASTEHNGVQSSHRKCSLHHEEEICPNITL